MSKTSSPHAGGGLSRGAWTSSLGFVLAAVGSAIGLGNIWKFPYITWAHGGGAFVLVYLICILLVGFPIMIAEIYLGKRTHKDPVGAFRELAGHSSLWRFVGWLGVASGFVILSYYSVVAGWTVNYFLETLLGDFKDLTQDEVGAHFGEFVGNGWAQVGYHLAFMIICVGIVIGGVSRGIERANRVLMPVLLGLLVTLVILSLQTPGAAEGVWFLFRPDFAKMDAAAVLEALGHAFFTLSLGMGAMITYGSYMRSDEQIATSAVAIVCADTFIALMACLMIYPIIFSFELEPTASVGILFTTLPHLFLKMPAGWLVGPLFFLLVSFAALTSAISLLEVVVAHFIDAGRFNRKISTLVAATTIFILGIPSALSNGAWKGLSGMHFLGERNFFDSMDYLASNWMLPLGGLGIAIYAGWFVARTEAAEELQQRMPWLFGLWHLLLRYVTPLLVILVILNLTTDVFKR